MGADLFESYVGSLVSALTLGTVGAAVSGVVFPLVIAACGLLASIIGTFFVKGDEKSSPQKALTRGSYVSAILVIIASVVLSKVLFDGFQRDCGNRRPCRGSNYRKCNRVLYIIRL